MNSGIELDDDILENSEVSINEVTVQGLLSNIKSGIGLDIAKNHSGICIWEDNQIHLFGFELCDYDKSDYFAEYKMRLDFKNKLKALVQGKSFEYCIVEDVYGGDNFDTTRKLLALNTVIDELIYDGVCSVDDFVRWSATKWMSYFRLLYKQKGKLKSKFETQGILEYLKFDFYLQNKDLSDSEKKKIFFEDICDATGMLCGMIMAKISDNNISKQSFFKLSDIKMYYLEDLSDIYSLNDKRIQEEGYDYAFNMKTRDIESEIILKVQQHPNSVLCAYLPVNKLGVFGIKHKFTFYESGEGYLLFYKR